jgi:hypothetical protein
MRAPAAMSRLNSQRMQHVPTGPIVAGAFAR